jgi:transaldolase
MISALRGTYHLTELAGGELCMSIAPAAQEWFVTQDLAREERIEKEIPREAIERLYRLPEFVKAYEPEGMASKDFIGYGAVQRTLCEYIESGWKLMERF